MVMPEDFSRAGLYIFVLLVAVCVGLMCIAVPWYVIAGIVLGCGLVFILLAKFRLIGYILVFSMPLWMAKNPSMYFTGSEMVKSDAVSIIPSLAVMIAGIPFLVNTFTGLYVDRSRKNPLSVLALIVLGYGFLGMLWSPAPRLINLIHLFMLGINIMIFMVLFRVIDGEKYHRRLMWWLMAAGVLLVLQCIIAPRVTWAPKTVKIAQNTFFSLGFTGNPTPDKPSMRSHGFFIAEQDTSILMTCLMMVAVGLMLNEKRRSRMILLAALVLFFLLGQFLSRSKVGTYALLPLIFIIPYYARRLQDRFFRMTTIVFVALIFTFMVGQVVSTLSWGRGETKGARVTQVNATEKEGSIQQRLGFWQKGFWALRDHSMVLSGLGPGGYRYAAGPVHPHNLYLNFYFDYGIPGLVFILWTIVIVARDFFILLPYQNTYLQKMAIAFGIMYFGLCMMCFVFVALYVTYWWLLLALTCATMSLARVEMEKLKGLGTLAV